MLSLRQTGTEDNSLPYRRLLTLACGIALCCVTAHTLFAFWAQSELTQPEGIVATQSMALARHGSLYYDLKQYPYTVCAYMPTFYWLEASLFQLGIPLLLGGRLISQIALAGILYLIWQVLYLYTGNKHCALTGVALAGMTQPLLHWAAVGQVDTLAIAFSLAAFHQYVRYQIQGKESLDWAAFFALAALFTKQTAIAAPTAIFILLALIDWRRAVRFGLLVGGVGGVLVLGLNSLMNGRFLANTLYANMNPFAWDKMKVQLVYAATILYPLLIVLLTGIRKAQSTAMRTAFVYFGLALAVFLATSSKIGADSNYVIETSILMVVCACLSLQALDFFHLFSSKSKSLVTLLVLPLALYGSQNLRLATFEFSERIMREQQFSAQLLRLKPYLHGSGLVLSADSNALVHSSRRFEVEPLIYRLLVEAGIVDPGKVLHDIENCKFQAILLFENTAEAPNTNPEFPSLTPQQLAAIRSSYRQVDHITGPYLGGLYVYQPAVKKSTTIAATATRVDFLNLD